MEAMVAMEAKAVTATAPLRARKTTEGDRLALSCALVTTYNGSH